MNNSIRLFCLLLVLTFISYRAGAQNYQSQNINLLSNWIDPAVTAEPVYGIKYNGIWGWDDGNGREYAIIGATNGTYILEVTNPSSPQLRDFVPGLQTNCIWREYKTYGNYLYMVSDDAAPNGLQIADLSFLPDSVHVVHSSDTIIQRCHTIFIDGDNLYGGSVTGGAVGGYASMAVYSLANPEAPQLMRTLNQDLPSISTVHDMLVRNDTVYASAAFQGLFILKYLSNNTFSQLASLTIYTDQGYNHSSALTDNGATLIFCDEVPADLAVKSLDVSDLSNLQMNALFKSNPGATAHNPFIIGNDIAVIAYYKDGLRIFNISDPSNPVPSGFFDTYWQNDSCVCYNETSSAYAGNWGAYPYFPSGNIIASDMQNGLFVLDAAAAVGIREHQQPSEKFDTYPNPLADELNMELDLEKSQKVHYELTDAEGRRVLAGQMSCEQGKSWKKLNLESLSPGMYLLKVTGDSFFITKKVVRGN
jgi:choice-of-anchor B domain-containing protein